jgi:hypothetical protein
MATKKELLDKYADDKSMVEFIDKNYDLALDSAEAVVRNAGRLNDSLPDLPTLDLEARELIKSIDNSTISAFETKNYDTIMSEAAILNQNISKDNINKLKELKQNLEQVGQPEEAAELGIYLAHYVRVSDNAQRLTEIKSDYQKILDQIQERLRLLDPNRVVTGNGRQARSQREGARNPELIEFEERQREALLLRAKELKELSEDIFEEPLSTPFKEQCFIQQNVYELINLKKQYFDDTTQLPYEEGIDSGFNRPLLVSGQPFGFMNKLTQPVSTSTLFDIPSTVLSQLQPMIRLYKIDENDNQIEIKFPSKIEFGRDKDGRPVSITNAMKRTKRRGFGAGLKNFSFTYKGSDPFSVKKAIEAQLTIYAASFEELLDNRGGYSYADLALKTGTSLMEQNIQSDNNSKSVIDNLDKLKFRLKAVVGYEMPSNLHIPSTPGLSRENVAQAINNSFVTLTLTPTIHEFKFRENGELDFTINYLSYIEDFFDQAYFNVFSDPKITSENYMRGVLKKYYEKNCLVDDLKNLREGEDRKIDIEQRASLRSLIENLLSSGKIANIKVAYDELGQFITNPNTSILSRIYPTETLNDDLSTGVTEEAKETPTENRDNREAVRETLTNSDVDANIYEQINFFYFNDLIEIAMGNIENSLSNNGYLQKVQTDVRIDEATRNTEIKKLKRMRENFKKLRVILGPIEIRDPRNPGKYINASIGDVPISLKYFTEWMTEKVIARERLEYSLTKFVNDFVKNYLRNFLNNETCYAGRSKQRVLFFSANISSYSRNSQNRDEISAMIDEIRANQSDEQFRTSRLNLDTNSFDDCILNVMGIRGYPNPQRDFSNQYNYMVFYAGRSQPQKLMSGDLLTDHGNGIFHYILGKNNGIVKTIDLTRTNVTGLRELRFEQEGFDGLQQLREVYNAGIKTFSLPSAVPGTYIFIDPRGFAPDTNGYTNTKTLNIDNKKVTVNFDKYELSKFGIGGYFMIVESQHTFSEGLAESQITAKWVAQLEKDATDPANSQDEITSGAGKPQKCKTKRTKGDVQVSIPGITTPNDTVGTSG